MVITVYLSYHKFKFGRPRLVSTTSKFSTGAKFSTGGARLGGGPSRYYLEVVHTYGHASRLYPTGNLVSKNGTVGGAGRPPGGRKESYLDPMRSPYVPSEDGSTRVPGLSSLRAREGPM
eukprot:SAG31_NODE_13432_length_869_cov_3.449351_1_plen_119_part_00